MSEIGERVKKIVVEHLGVEPEKVVDNASFIDDLGAEYAKRNVTANCIAPGFIATPMTDALNEKQREAILTKVPAARLGSPEDIAAAAVYLSSNEAAYVTGQTIHVNGGMAMI